MKKILNGKNILVTGSNRGIGKSIIEMAASYGANLWANARKREQDFEDFCKKTSLANNVVIEPIYFDLQSKDQILAGVKEIKKSDREINGLISNAGITYNALFQMSSEDNIRENLDINFIGPFLLTQYVVKLMTRANGGSIISIASSAALDGNQGRSAYGASKAALLTATKSLSREVGEFNIRANIIAPGITETEMLTSMSQETIDLTLNETSLKRSAHPSEIANVACFLVSDLSSYITGQTIRVDGGM
jgi:3-oxoacyl-[acyl-carrier protein] reductase